MKLLIATRKTQGQQPTDFAFCVDGELVVLGMVCGRDQRDPDGPDACGCARAFTGLNSARATTTAEVVDLPLTRTEIEQATRVSLTRSGWNGDRAKQVAATMLDIAQQHEVGTVLTRRLDDTATRL